MRKKPLKNQKDNATHVSFDRALLQAIRRQKNRQHDSRLFDASLPDDVRFLGLISRHPKTQSPHITQSPPTELSPFILELRNTIQTPQEILSDETYSPVLLNFLTNFSELSTEPHKNIDTSQDLVLSKTDVQKQFGLGPTSSFLHLTKTFFQKKSEKKPENIPLQMPENLLSYFDLPEEEPVFEEESVELVELNDLVASVATKEAPQEKLPRMSFSFLMPNGWQRAIGAFVLVSFVFVLPIHAMQFIHQLREAKSSVQSNGVQALASLKTAAGANLVTNPKDARASFEKANAQFGQAEKTIKQLGVGVNLLLSTLGTTQKTVKTNRALLLMGSEIALAGTRITEGLEAMKQELRPTPSSRVQILQLYLESALPHLLTAKKALSNVDINTLKEDHQETSRQLQTSLPALSDSVQEFLSLSDTILSILGTNGTKKYLLIFQNNTEIR
ncbi:MAG: hypothetical protein AAB664_03760, partial [Patescibacteria group bacterium]